MGRPTKPLTMERVAKIMAGYAGKSKRQREREKLKPKKNCRACHKIISCRPRGLCWKCYYDPLILARFPSSVVLNGVPDFMGHAPPGTPTDARPGTPQKVAVLEERAALGQDLFHPHDA